MSEMKQDHAPDSTVTHPPERDAPRGPTTARPPRLTTRGGPDDWWQGHFHEAPNHVIEFFRGSGVSLAGKRVADIGCGDGILDLALALRAQPKSLVGMDIVPTDTAHLARLATEHADISAFPDNLSFVTCGETTLPAASGSFDYVISWSAFEHILDPVKVLSEIRRILTPDGILFIQLWPFYDSEHGTHLMEWFPKGFAQYRRSDKKIARVLGASDDQRLAGEMLEAYRTLNRITADGLHGCLIQAGFRTTKLELQTGAVELPRQVSHLPFSRVGISGIKLLAVPHEVPQAPVRANHSAKRSLVKRARRILRNFRALRADTK